MSEDVRLASDGADGSSPDGPASGEGSVGDAHGLPRDGAGSGPDAAVAPPPSGSGEARGGPVVVLVGVPGAGKSTVGRALAERLGVELRDTDADVEATTGRTIADIFVESGETTFRALEAEAVDTALRDHDGVLALGGGAVLDPETRRRLAGRPVVWLRVGVPAAAHRAGLSAPRPVLFGNLRGQLRTLMEQRAPLYQEVASLVLDTDNLEPQAAVTAIVDALAVRASAR